MGRRRAKARANKHPHTPFKGRFYRSDCLTIKGPRLSHARPGDFHGAFTASLGFPNLPNMCAQECASLAVQGKVLRVSCCLAFLTALVPGMPPERLDLLARRQRDERRGVVGVLLISLSLGCHVPLPPCPSACGTESGEPSLVIGSGAVHLSPHPAEPLPFPADTRHNLALAECFCREPRARQTGALTRGQRRKAWAPWPLSRPFFA